MLKSSRQKHTPTKGNGRRKTILETTNNNFVEAVEISTLLLFRLLKNVLQRGLGLQSGHRLPKGRHRDLEQRALIAMTLNMEGKRPEYQPKVWLPAPEHVLDQTTGSGPLAQVLPAVPFETCGQGARGLQPFYLGAHRALIFPRRRKPHSAGFRGTETELS
eukprot:6457055-Amphidinium_carterae.1